MRKVHVQLTVKLILNMDEKVETNQVINELDYSFLSSTDGVMVEDSEIKDYEILDSK